ncbi:hypothetical protein [Pseudocolwellia agarivorans]|uniref:hypothetical protein n=1 Tax=Pseudocolwellia agarivorans TaxID=1911682 RepID=UPI000984F201|nr:hypothetical protein [Pseudocolwellia agarivorans]
MDQDKQRNQRFNYKGYIAENFVQNELVAQFDSSTYSWEYARSEIDSSNGKISSYGIDIK